MIRRLLTFFILTLLAVFIFSAMAYLVSEAFETPLPYELPTSIDNTELVKVISWEDSNHVGAKISLYYDTDQAGADGTLLVTDIPSEDVTNKYYWNTINVPNGTYYVYLAYDTGQETAYHYLGSPVTLNHSTQCLDIQDRTNLLSNPGFETGVANLPLGWFIDTPGLANRERQWTAEWTNNPAEAHSGNRAIKMGNIFNGVNSESEWQDRVILRSETIDLPIINGKYLLAGWIKGTDLEGAYVMARIKYFDEAGNQLQTTGHHDDTVYLTTHEPDTWTPFTILLNPPHWPSPPYSSPATAYKAQVNLSLLHSPGTLWIDDLALTALSYEEYQHFKVFNRYDTPPLNTKSPTTSPETTTPDGFDDNDPQPIRVQQNREGVWWLVDGDGEQFWSMGLNYGSNQKLLDRTGLNAADYRQLAQYRAHADLNFSRGWRDTREDGTFSGTQRYMHWLNFGSEAEINAPPQTWVLRDRQGNLIAEEGHYFPDVFSPIWQEYALAHARTLLEDDGWVLDNPQTVGYWTDNEWAYGDLYDFMWGNTAQLAFVDWLQGRNDLPSVDAVFAQEGSSINLDVPPGFGIADAYPSIEAVNQQWSSAYHTYQYGSFAEIIGQDKPYIRAHDDPVLADLYAFERVIFKLYVDTVVDNIRQVEQEFMNRTGRGANHLIFSNRFDLYSPVAINAMARNIDLFERFDVIALNLYYPFYNQSSPYLPEAWVTNVTEIFHKQTGRPIYISEFGVAAEVTSNDIQVPYLLVSRWRDITLNTLPQRGWAYKAMVNTWANLPFVVGADWFQWSNGYGNPPGSDPRNSGLVDDTDHYYPYFIDEVRSVNKQLTTVERRADFDITDINWDSIRLNICEVPRQATPSK